jgi:hypothetical protein
MRMTREKTRNERNVRNCKQNSITANAVEAGEDDTIEQEESITQQEEDEDIPPITHVVDSTTVNIFGRTVHRIGGTNDTLTARDAEEDDQAEDRVQQAMADMGTQTTQAPNRIKRGVGRPLKATTILMPKVGYKGKSMRARLELNNIILILPCRLTLLRRIITPLGILKTKDGNDMRSKMVSAAKTTETVMVASLKTRALFITTSRHQRPAILLAPNDARRPWLR